MWKKLKNKLKNDGDSSASGDPQEPKIRKEVKRVETRDDATTRRTARGLGEGADKQQEVIHEIPQDIQESLAAVQLFISKTKATICHKCQTPLMDSFSVKDWMKAWSEGARHANENNLICAASCPRCRALTCLGCGDSPEGGRNRRVQNLHLDWCCKDGRLFGIWVLLARYDEVELQMQASEAHQKSVKSRGQATPASMGIGYAGDRHVNEFGFVPAFHDGPGAPPQRLSQAIDFKKADEKTDHVTTMIMDLVAELLPAPGKSKLPPELHGMLQLSLIVDKAAELLRNDSLDDVCARSEVYTAVLSLVDKLGGHPELLDLVQHDQYPKRQTSGLQKLSEPKDQKGKSVGKEQQHLVFGDPRDGKASSLAQRLENLAKQSQIVLKSDDSRRFNDKSGKVLLDLCKYVAEVFDGISATGDSKGKEDKMTKESQMSPGAQWDAYHKENCLIRQDGVLGKMTTEFRLQAERLMHSTPGRMKRLVMEAANMATSLPLGIFVKVEESRPDVMKALIMGPPDTPYAYGLYEFDILCTDQYPSAPPLVWSRTATGKCNFNPNIHPDGKVCLSLLGTWHEGDAAAQWQPGKSTILSVLISIQAMIFNEDPYHNEPRFTDKTPAKARAAKRYINIVQPVTIQFMMLDWMQKKTMRQGLWRDVVEAHFDLNARNIITTVEKWSLDNKAVEQWDGTVRFGGRGPPDMRPGGSVNMLETLREALEWHKAHLAAD